MKGKRKALSALIVSLIAALLIFIPVMAAPQTAEAATISPQVTYHSQAEIYNYYKSKGINFNAVVSYKTAPKKYNTAGALDEKTSKQALANLNYIRFIAGINSNVTLNSEYSEKAQYAAFINDLNGSVDHYPNKPNGVSESVYKKGYDGSDECSLSGWNNVNYALIRWMHEIFNSSKYYPLGHRMHIIDPSLKQTGFGNSNTSGGASAMYTSGTRNYSASEKYVVWPAQQTPIDVWAGATKWSVSTFDKEYDANKIKIKITSGSKVWNISKNSNSQGTLSVEKFGFINYLMFEPKDLTPEAGEKYNVEITNLGSNTLKYSVQFFDINDVEGFFKENNIWVYRDKNGDIVASKNGVYCTPDGIWYYTEKGKQNNSFTGVAKSTNNNWIFVRNGKYDTSYTGVAKSTNGNWVFVKKGRYDTSYTGVAQSTTGNWVFVKNGRYDTSFTGVAQSTTGNWVYVKNGRYNTSVTGVEKSINGNWVFVKAGRYDTSFSGVAKSSEGKWMYVKNGRYDSSFTGVTKSINGNWVFVRNGIYDTSFTGVAKSTNNNPRMLG